MNLPKLIIVEAKSKAQFLHILGNRFVRKGKLEVKMVDAPWDISQHLTKDDKALIFMHHTDYSEVDDLRKKFPNCKYAAYTGLLRDMLGYSKEGEILEFVKEMKAHYDLCCYSIEDIPKFLDSFAQNRL